MILGGIGTIIVGILFLVVGIYNKNIDKKRKKKCTSVTEGVIIDFKSWKRIDGKYRNITYFPIYQYIVDNNKYEVLGNGIEVYSGENKEEKLNSMLGQKREIMYNPSNYIESYVKEENRDIINKVLIIGGVMIIVIGIFSKILFIAIRSVL